MSVTRAGKRDEILATFIRHVAERGYEQANLGDVAGELGMSKGTIVHHFGTKAQMLRELEEIYMRRHLTEVRAMWGRLPGPAERVAALIYAAVHLQVSDRDATVAAQREVVQLAGDPAMLEIRGLRRELLGLLRAELERGVRASLFRPVDATVVASQIFGSAQWMWTWFDPDGERGTGEVGGTYVDVFLGGLLVERDALASLADPRGHVNAVVRECMGLVD
ncbi:TetR/AcrR family transcriptional regulator [Nonomuraea sp. NPDC050556]|uniref:TetR/AcrR family transcriptional regulator n=1 Tax=Nonomuraea sp. NPDC050556 TaxID=3364369 RepID=UPI0037B733DF